MVPGRGGRERGEKERREGERREGEKGGREERVEAVSELTRI